ncbi:Zinc finger RING-type [Penicillium robsamsonii]|uniref:Zinc finger RING-type n=1 Tax=Penicillium robsamsonii TaxID=1792511 RepID=UPI002546B5E4|nr:Zinc finger RING-type [Penicillium robsamsonii]KAJ5812707.1 Zinc finger RING-type [Penicillium robsamsonii]
MSRNSPEVVDLTTRARSPTRAPRQNPISLSSSPPGASDHASSSQHAQLHSPRGVKRRRNWSDEHGTSSSTLSEDEPIETIDMTDDSGAGALARAVAKQREAAAKAQAEEERNANLSAILAYKCPICMETPVDATSTSCGVFLILHYTGFEHARASTDSSYLGHLFCHKCIIDCLKMSEQTRGGDSSKQHKGTCPVCRTPISRKETPGRSKNLIPLLFQTRKRGDLPAPGP